MTLDEAKAGFGRRVKTEVGTVGTNILCPYESYGQDKVWIIPDGWKSPVWTTPDRVEFIDEAAPAAPPASRDFPHTCARCGDRVYIGFARVEHQHGGSECSR